jgi:putative tryptophan/tyrosine transport system substrate-binding protein
MARVGHIVQTPHTPGRSIATEYKDSITAAQALRVALVFAKVDQPDQFPDAFTTLARAPVDALLIDDNALTYANGRLIVEFAAQHRLPAMYAFRETVEAGGLMAYGASLTDLLRRAAGYVDKILNLALRETEWVISEAF